MMEPDDDDMSHSTLGDSLFALELEEEEEQEPLASLLLEQGNNNNNNNTSCNQRRVKSAAVCGGVTGALLSVPLVAIDFTVLAVAGPAIAAAAAGGAAVLAATHRTNLHPPDDGESKEEENENSQPQEQHSRFRWFPQSSKKPEEGRTETDESSTESSSCEHHNNDDNDDDEEQKEGETKQPQTGVVGLRGAGLLWIMAQKKHMDEEVEVAQALKQMDQDLRLPTTTTTPKPKEVNFFRELTRIETPVKGPLGWLAQRRHEVAPTQVPPTKEEHVEVQQPRGWFGRSRLDDTEIEPEETSEYDEASSDGKDDEYSLDGSQYDEEEVVFDESCFDEALFTDGLVEQQLQQAQWVI